MKLLGKYKNGNYNVVIFDDGTKIRQNELDNLTPEFPESIDMKITDNCDMGCEFCYAGATKDGKHGELLNVEFLNTLKPYTELAINGNALNHPQLIQFLENCKSKNIIVSMTVNQNHFMKYIDFCKMLSDNKLIHGLGISLTVPTTDFINNIRQFPNAVIHIINGVTDIYYLDMISNQGLKILILGYKYCGRGEQYFMDNISVISKQKDMSDNIDKIIQGFKAVAFDNKALLQLGMKSRFTDSEWEEFYMGDDGKFTMYIDLVKQTFSKNSLCEQEMPILDNIIDMFNIVKTM